MNRLGSKEYSSRFATFSETFRGLSGGGNLTKIVSPQESFSRLKINSEIL